MLCDVMVFHVVNLNLCFCDVKEVSCSEDVVFTIDQGEYI
jgi:hypothetical protein